MKRFTDSVQVLWLALLVVGAPLLGQANQALGMGTVITASDESKGGFGG